MRPKAERDFAVGVNNLDYNLGIIQLIIPNKQGLMCLAMSGS
jgi:hypothetical protein